MLAGPLFYRPIRWLTVEGAIGCNFTWVPATRGNCAGAIICETDCVLPNVDNGQLSTVMIHRALPLGYTEKQLVMAAASAVREIYDHEWREQFRYRGERVFDPHAARPGLVLP